MQILITQEVIRIKPDLNVSNGLKGLEHLNLKHVKIYNTNMLTK